MFLVMKFLRVWDWEVKLQEIMIEPYDQNLGTMNHQGRRGRKLWSWFIRDLESRDFLLRASTRRSTLSFWATAHHHLGMGQNWFQMVPERFLVDSSIALSWQHLPFDAEIPIFAGEDITLDPVMNWTTWPAAPSPHELKAPGWWIGINEATRKPAGVLAETQLPYGASL